MLAVPVHMPADPEIGATEVAAVDRTGPFLREGRYLIRESHGGPAWFAVMVYILLTGVAGGVGHDVRDRGTSRAPRGHPGPGRSRVRPCSLTV